MLVGMIACLLSPRCPNARVRGRVGRRENFVAPLTDLWHRFGPMLARDPAACRALSPAGFPQRRDGEPALYRAWLFEEPDRHHVESLRHLDRHRRRFRRGLCDHPLGLMPALLIGGIAAAASHLCLALLAASGQEPAAAGALGQCREFRRQFRRRGAHRLYVVAHVARLCRDQYALLVRSMRCSASFSAACRALR